MHFRYLFFAIVASLLLEGPARADFEYEFASAGNALGTTAFSVAQGSTLSIQVYLVQTNGPTVNSTNLTANGLANGAVALQYASTGPVSITNTSAITPNSAFALGSPSLSTSNGTTTAAVQVYSGPTPVFAPTSGADAGAVLLGTFTFTGTSAGTATTFTAFPNTDPPIANNVDGMGNNLDSLIQQSSAVITVTAVPEPGTFLLTGLLASGIAAGAWRRRRLSTKAPA